MPLSLCQWQGKPERCPTCWPAVYPDSTTMCLDSKLTECQSEANTALPAQCGLGNLYKLFEDSLSELNRDAFTSINNADLNLTATFHNRCFYPDLALGGCVPHRIVH